MTRGFGGMSAEKQRAIAQLGGLSVPAEKRSFSQNRELAREAGRKGGSAKRVAVETPSGVSSEGSNPAAGAAGS